MVSFLRFGEERCRASRHTSSGPPQFGGKPGATRAAARKDDGLPDTPSGPPQFGGAQRYKGSCKERCWASRHTVGTPTIRGSFGFAQDKKPPSRLRASQRYKGSCKERCRAEAR